MERILRAGLCRSPYRLPILPVRPAALHRIGIQNRITTLLACLLVLLSHAPLTFAGPAQDWLEGRIGPDLPPVSANGETYQLRFSHPAPPVSLVTPLFEKGFAWLRNASANRLQIRQYPGGTLHGAKQGFAALRAGITQYATCYTIYENQGFSMSRVFNQPFLSPERSAVATRVFAELAPRYFAAEFKRRGVVHGYSAFFQRLDLMSRKPVRRLEDLRGMRIIAMGLSPETAKALGFTALNIPFPEIYTALSQGLADGVFWMDTGFVPFRIYEVAKHLTRVGLYAGSLDTCINRRTWKELDPELRRLFAAFQQASAASLVQIAGIEFAAKAKAAYRANNVQIHTLDDDERQRWVAAARPAVDAWLRQCNHEGKPCRKLLRDIRDHAAKYTDVTDEEVLRLMIEKPVLPTRREPQLR